MDIPDPIEEKPVTNGARVAAERVIDLLEDGWMQEEILQTWPSVTESDLRACIEQTSALSRTQGQPQSRPHELPRLSDTQPEARRVQIELMRRTPLWRKLALLGQMTATVRQLALLGLRRRHPEATARQLRRYLAEQLLGPELAADAYGPLEDADAD